LRRSVAVALGNWLAVAAPTAPRRGEAVKALELTASRDPSDVVREHAAWALGRAGR
jgi:epoxyqueuosine reductase QueG